ncbi:MAG: hypothetical protein G01um101477_531, partial [Candidatus Doudnabacteria bacterium Gr01-1014_77]
MNKKNIILFSILIVFLIISIYFNLNEQVDTRNKGINDSLSSKISVEELFEKKQECQKYAQDIEKTLKELDFYNPNTGYQDSHFLEELFYSPKANTCLYIEREWGF